MSASKILIRHTIRLMAALALGIFSNPLPAQSQTVRGRVLESQSALPVVSAGVVLLDTSFVSVAGTATSASGGFILEAPGPGSYFVLTESLGYSPSIDGILELSEGGVIAVEIYLKPQPIVLDSIKVAVARAQVFVQLEKTGFNERQESGFGHFITPDEIQRRNPRTPRDLFRNTPGITLVDTLAGTAIYFRHATFHGGSAGSELGRCSPQIYVDGNRVNADPYFGGLQGVADISAIAAVEVYTRASNVPLQWGGTNAGCGIVLIWTR